MQNREIILGQIEYFAQLPEAELHALADNARRLQYDAGDALFHEGDPAPGLFYLCRGGVKAVRYSSEGRQLIIREFGPGETFNEVGALDGSPNAATVVATKRETEVLLIPGEDVRGLVTRYPDLGAKIMEAMANKLRFAMGKVNRLALMDVKARLAAHLVDTADQNGELRGVSQEELAAQLGTVRQVVGRILNELQKAGTLQVQRGIIRIIDHHALDDLLEP